MDRQDQFILSIDGGTQSTKVAIFDLSGQEICAHSVKLRPLDLSPDWRAEHPDDDLWDSLVAACQATLAKFSGDPKAIIGIGLGSIRCCRALLRDDGTLAAPIQNWMDHRLSKPYEHTDDTVRYVTTTTGYLTHRLTGQAKDTRANYVGPWPIDPITLEWMAAADDFAAFTTPREMLFDLVDAGTIVGSVTDAASHATSLPVGIPVIATANDKAVEALGAGLSQDGSVLVSLGTYIAGMMQGDENTLDTQSYFCNPGAFPNEFLYESGGIRRGMSTVTWIKDLMGHDIETIAAQSGLSAEAYLNQVAASEVPAGSLGLFTVLNWLARPSNPHERGMMIGFNGSHKGPHMFRSILEGIAMTMKNNVMAMCAERGTSPKRLIISGGGSNGDLFMQIFADVFNLEAVRNQVNGSASLGAAICAAVALGVYPNRDEAIKNMVRVRDSFAPILENVAIYDQINETVYKHLATAMDPLLRTSHNLFFED